ncbi:MAG TPA: D-2-hydroxyacid dehydrogenase family protein [Usitatibacteraceae bacterium]
MKIVIPDDYQDAARSLRSFAKLAGHEVQVYRDTVKSVDALVERFKDAEALVLIRERTRISRELVARLPKLRLISQAGHGGAHIDIDACTEFGITVCASGISNPDAAAEITWALLLASARFIISEANRAQQGLWQGRLGESVSGKLLGIVGYGKIGQRIARYGQAFGMSVAVLGHRPSTMERARADGLRVIEDRRTFFAQSDFVSLHLRLNADTRDFVTLDDLLAMKPTAHLINTARSRLIASGALVRALDAGRPGYAAVDVYDDEPITRDHPLLGRNNVICTPHIGYTERGTYEVYLGAAFDQIVAFAAGNPIHVLGGSH